MRGVSARHHTVVVRAVAVALVLFSAAGSGFSAVGSGGTTAVASARPTSTTGWASSSEIDAYLRKKRSDLKLSGLAVVVLAKGSTVFARTYGEAAPGGPAVTPNTPFVLGSTSKQFTGLAIQQLIAQRKLSPGDTVGTLLRQLGGGTSPLAAVSVKQLLSHTSGISTESGNADVFDPIPAFTSLEAETRHLLRSAPASRPGRFEYSNANYTLLGSIVESVTGQSFEGALQTLVARPLGLEATTSDLALAQKKGLAVGHYRWFGAVDSTTPGPRWPMGAPSAYTTSTAADLTRLLQAELGKPSGVDAAVFAADHAPLSTVDDFFRYASGWYVRSLWELHDDDENFDDPALPLIYEHDGTTGREMSYLAFSPDLGLSVVVLSNTGLGTDQARLGVFTSGLLHTIVGTRARPAAVDPLIAAAPPLMVALPLLQLAATVALVLSVLRPRRRRLRRLLARSAAAIVTISTLLFAFVVVPRQTHEPLLQRDWWAGVPDLATSIAISVLFAAACLVVAGAAVVRALGPGRGRQRAVAPATAAGQE